MLTGWRTKRYIQWPIFVLLVLAILYVLTSLFGITGQICGHTCRHDQCECDSYNLVLVILWKVFKAFDAASALITAIATAVLTYVTYLLFQLGHEQSVTSRAPLRAYVSLEEGGITVGETDQPRAEIIIQNFGQTPAYKLTYWADCRLTGMNDTPPFEMPEGAQPSPEIVLGPSGKFRIQPYLIDQRQDDVPYTQYRVERRRAMIHAFGKITYTDAFNEEHMTEFFLQVPLPGGAFYAVGEHNNAT